MASIALVPVVAWSSPAAVRAAPRVRIAHWTTAEGLPQNTINDIVIRPNGELWLATFGGLARFDGERFKVVDIASDEGLPANRITALALAGDELWFVTQQGHVGRLDGSRAVPVMPSAITERDVSSLAMTAAGDFYIQTVLGDVWVGRPNQGWRQELEARPGGNGLHSLVNDEGGNVWALWGERLTGLGAVASRPGVALGARRRTCTRRSAGGLWIGKGSDVAVLRDGVLEPQRVVPPIEADITVIEEAGPTTLWVAAFGELSRLERGAGGTWSRSVVNLGLPAGFYVRSLRLDHEGSLWVGTDGRGLFRIDETPTWRFGAEVGLAEVTGAVGDGQGGAWVASGCRGVFHLDAAGIVTPLPQVRAAEDDLGCDFGLAQAADGRAWVHAGARVYLVGHGGAKVVFDSPDLEYGPIAAAPDGTAWVASHHGDLVHLSAAGAELRRVRVAAAVVCLAVAPDGSVWLGGEGEVFHVTADRVERFGAAEQVPRGAVRDLLAEADGTVWVATYGGGLGRLHGGRVARVSADQGLPDNSLSRVLEDANGRIWVSTNRGVVMLQRADLEAVAAGTARALDPVVLGPERGVPEANFGRPAGFIDERQRLWLGTIDGLVRIDASRFPFNHLAPAVRIEEVSADDHGLPFDGALRVPPLTARVRLTFTSFALRYPERMRFRFRVDGVDRDWVQAETRRFAVWTPSGPGHYRFLVQARNEDGVWNTDPAVLDLELLPAWWQTGAARAMGIAAVALVTFGAYRRRLRLIERRHAERLQALEERRAAEERAASLRVQLEHVSRVALAGELAASLAHEVNQPLAAIVTNAQTGRIYLAKGPEAWQQIDEILADIVASGIRASDVIRGLRGFLRAGDAGAARVNLSVLVREMLPLVRRELEEHAVRVDLSLAEPVPPVRGVRVRLGQIVVNLVMNACEALTAIDEPRRIAIATSVADGRVRLTVCDNGPGVPADVVPRMFEPFVTTKADGMGMGLAICRSIAEAHGGQLVVETPADGGTRMVLWLPADVEAT